MLKNAEWARWGNAEIARAAGCDESYVRQVEKKLTSESLRRSGRHLVRRRGKVQEMNTTGIGQAADPQPEPIDLRPPDPTARPTIEPGAAQYKTIFVWREAWNDIRQLPVKDIVAEDCVLWLQFPGTRAQDALDVITGWGFRLHSLPNMLEVRPGRHAVIDNDDGLLVAVRENPAMSNRIRREVTNKGEVNDLLSTKPSSGPARRSVRASSCSRTNHARGGYASTRILRCWPTQPRIQRRRCALMGRPCASFSAALDAVGEFRQRRRYSRKRVELRLPDAAGPSPKLPTNASESLAFSSNLPAM